MKSFLIALVLQEPGFRPIQKFAEHKSLEELRPLRSGYLLIVEQNLAVFRKCFVRQTDAPANLCSLISAMVEKAAEMDVLRNSSDRIGAMLS